MKTTISASKNDSETIAVTYWLAASLSPEDLH